MNNDNAEQALQKCCKALGSEIKNASRLNALLNDLAAGEDSAIHLLMTAHRFGIIKAFEGVDKKDKAEIQLRANQFFREQLLTKAHLSSAAAAWTLAAWLKALGISFKVVNNQPTPTHTKNVDKEASVPHDAPAKSTPQKLTPGGAIVLTCLLLAVGYGLFLIKDWSIGGSSTQQPADVAPTSPSISNIITPPSQATEQNDNPFSAEESPAEAGDLFGEPSEVAPTEKESDPNDPFAGG